jgi:hypothetical protein
MLRSLPASDLELSMYRSGEVSILGPGKRDERLEPPPPTIPTENYRADGNPAPPRYGPRPSS